MAYKISGKVMAVTTPQQLTARSGSTYVKRELVMQVRKFDPYTGVPADDAGNTPKFTFFGDRCALLDDVRVGDVVTMSFEIYGRSYERDGRTEYMTDVRPLRVDVQHQPSGRPEPESPAMGEVQTAVNPFAADTLYPANNASASATTAPQGDCSGSKALSDDLPF